MSRRNTDCSIRVFNESVLSIPDHDKTKVDKRELLVPDHDKTMVDKSVLSVPDHDKTMVDESVLSVPDHDENMMDESVLSVPEHDKTMVDESVTLGKNFICHICPPLTRKRIVSLYFGREVRTRLGVAISVSGPPVFHIKAGASR